jgi:deazaflavin-dependent oxidoreductase (nitroreductase family)
VIDWLMRRAWDGFVRSHTAVYRLTGGRIGRRVLGGAPVLLLDHVGRKSGKKRTSPLLYIEEGEELVIVASKGGSHGHPAWWLNLREHPRTTVQVGGELRKVVARRASPEEKARLWPRLVEIWPDYEAYQRRTSRDIPVIVLSPAEAAS